MRGDGAYWSLPVVGETYDGFLNDINGFHVRAEHVRAALASATDGPVAEGNVGGGTGMICHQFKGGIGTASRVHDYTVGVLVQANHGRRERLRINGRSVTQAERPAARLSARVCAGFGVDHRHRRHRCAAAAASVPATGTGARRWPSADSVAPANSTAVT